MQYFEIADVFYDVHFVKYFQNRFLAAADFLQDFIDRFDLVQCVGVGYVHDVQQQVGVDGFFESRLKRSY